MGFELGYSKNMQARISDVAAALLTGGKEGDEILDGEAVIDRDVHSESLHRIRTNTSSDHQMDLLLILPKTSHLPIDC